MSAPGTTLGVAGAARPDGQADDAARDTTRLVGVVVFLGSWAVAFTSLFFAYLFLRAQSDLAWPPLGAPSPSAARLVVNTLVAVGGSVCAHLALGAARREVPLLAARWLAAASLSGLAFVLLQVGLWADLWAGGLVLPSANRYASVVYTLTGFHALHVLVGVAGLARLAWCAGRGRLSRGRHSAVRRWGFFWHFVGIVWLTMALVLFAV